MTATLKTRRHVIRAVYGEKLDALYPKNKGIKQSVAFARPSLQPLSE